MKVGDNFTDNLIKKRKIDFPRVDLNIIEFKHNISYLPTKLTKLYAIKS